MSRRWFGNVAISSNGFLSEIGKAVNLSDEIDWKYVHQHIRNRIAAIAVGSQTILVDNPSLLTKSEYLDAEDILHHPVRVVFDRRGRVNSKFQVFSDTTTPTIWITNSNDVYQGIIKIAFNRLSQVVLDLNRKLDELHYSGDVLVEGGASLLTNMINEGIITNLRVFRAPIVIQDGVKLFTDLILRTPKMYSSKVFGYGTEEYYSFE